MLQKVSVELNGWVGESKGHIEKMVRKSVERTSLGLCIQDVNNILDNIINGRNVVNTFQFTKKNNIINGRMPTDGNPYDKFEDGRYFIFKLTVKNDVKFESVHDALIDKFHAILENVKRKFSNEEDEKETLISLLPDNFCLTQSSIERVRLKYDEYMGRDFTFVIKFLN
jgi:hypothetical protein